MLRVQRRVDRASGRSSLPSAPPNCATEIETISFARPFARIGYLEGIERYSDGKYTRERLLDPQGAAAILTRARIAASRRRTDTRSTKFSNACLEPQLVQPTFVTGYPVMISPLAKRRPTIRS